MQRLSSALFCGSLLLLLASCATQNMFTATNPKAATGAADTTFRYNPGYQYTIRVDDKISVSVWDHDDISVGSVYGIYNSNEVYGKWLQVKASGSINVPKIGAVDVLGLTVAQAEEKLKAEYKKFIVNPVIELKILNKEVTILGELKTPGKYLLEKEHNSLVELIGRAGDFDFYANKKYIQVIRVVNNAPKTLVVDLTKMETFSTANIQLQPGDVIYVPSRKGKHWDKRAGSTIAPVASAVGAVVLVGGLIF